MGINESAENTAKAVEEKIDAARAAVGERGARIRETVGQVADNVKAKASSIREKIRDTEWDDVVDNVKGYVRDNPGKSVAIALGVGFAVGLLFRRRGDDWGRGRVCNRLYHVLHRRRPYDPDATVLVFDLDFGEVGGN